MVTRASIGYGSRFQNSNQSSPEAFTDLVGIEVTSITPPQPSRDSVDVTHELSPDSHREFIAGLVDPGEVSVEFNWTPSTGVTGLSDLYAELALPSLSATKTRRILFPNGASLQFEGFCTGISPEAPIDDKMTATATFKVSGQPFLTLV